MKLDLGPYLIDDVDSIESPGLIVFLDLVHHNIDTMLAIAKGLKPLTKS